MHPLADGNDMGGSLRLPAGYCNVIGLRPSAGRVPVYPAADGYAGLSVQGPMARTVDDVALLLSVMAGPDRRSPISLEEPGASFADVGDGSLAGLRIAFSPDLGRRRRGRGRDRAPACRAAAASLRDPRRLSSSEASPDFTGADECFRILRAWQFEATLGQVLDDNADDRPAEPVREHAGRPRADRPAGRAGSRAAHHAVPPDAGVPRQIYDALILPVAPLPAFDAGLQYPDRGGRADRSRTTWAGCGRSAT